MKFPPPEIPAGRKRWQPKTPFISSLALPRMRRRQSHTGEFLRFPTISPFWRNSTPPQDSTISDAPECPKERILLKSAIRRNPEAFGLIRRILLNPAEFGGTRGSSQNLSDSAESVVHSCVLQNCAESLSSADSANPFQTRRRCRYAQLPK